MGTDTEIDDYSTNAHERYKIRVASWKHQRLMEKLYDRKPCPDCGMLCQVCHQNKRCCLKQ